MEQKNSSENDNEIQLPIELIINIFQNLSGKEVYKCRRVCKLWKGAADLLIRDETHWQKYYKRDYGTMYNQARNKSALSYEGLYKSISLWPQIKSAKVRVKRFLIGEHMSNFQILNKDIIGVTHCTECQNNVSSTFCLGCNYIGYFDLKTGNELRRQSMHVEKFQEYKENDHFVAVLEKDLHAFTMSILPKSNPDSIIYQFETSHNYKHIFLHENALYYTDASDQNIRCVTANKKGEVNDNIICRTSDGLIPLYFSHIDNSINFISSSSAIYTLSGESYVMRQCIEPNELHNLRKYNFCDSAWRLAKAMKGRGGVFFTYGDIIIYGAPHGRLGIFYAPLENGPFDIYNTAPSVVLNLKEMVEFAQRSLICCIDVIEVENGHDIIVMTEGDIVIITFWHEFRQEDDSINDFSSLPKKKKSF